MQDSDVEKVRRGRNQDFVRKNHFYQDIISEDEHRQWYEGVARTRDYYLMISNGRQDVGMVYLKNITEDFNSGHMGLFFWDKQALHTRLPLLACIVYADFFFESVGLQNMEAFVRPDNTTVLNFLRYFRFDIVQDKTLPGFRANGTHGSFTTRGPQLLEIAQRLNRDKSTWPLLIDGDRNAQHHAQVLKLIP